MTVTKKCWSPRSLVSTPCGDQKVLPSRRPILPGRRTSSFSKYIQGVERIYVVFSANQLLLLLIFWKIPFIWRYFYHKKTKKNSIKGTILQVTHGVIERAPRNYQKFVPSLYICNFIVPSRIAELWKVFLKIHLVRSNRTRVLFFSNTIASHFNFSFPLEELHDCKKFHSVVKSCPLLTKYDKLFIQFVELPRKLWTKENSFKWYKWSFIDKEIYS